MASSKRYGKKAAQKVERAMHEMKRGKLKSGRSNKKVTDPKQAVAIGLSEARKAGGKVPPEPKKKAAAKKAAPKKTTAKKAAPKKATAKKAAPKKAVAKKAAPKKATAKKTAPKKTAPKKVAPKKAAPKKAAAAKLTVKRASASASPTTIKASSKATVSKDTKPRDADQRTPTERETTRARTRPVEGAPKRSPKRGGPDAEPEVSRAPANDGADEVNAIDVDGAAATQSDDNDGFEARFDGEGTKLPTDQANEDMLNGTAPHEQRALQRAAALQAVNQRLMRAPPTKPLFKHHRVGLHRTPHRG